MTALLYLYLTNIVEHVRLACDYFSEPSTKTIYEFCQNKLLDIYDDLLNPATCKQGDEIFDALDDVFSIYIAAGSLLERQSRIDEERKEIKSERETIEQKRSEWKEQKLSTHKATPPKEVKSQPATSTIQQINESLNLVKTTLHTEIARHSNATGLESVEKQIQALEATSDQFKKQPKQAVKKTEDDSCCCCLPFWNKRRVESENNNGYVQLAGSPRNLKKS